LAQQLDEHAHRVDLMEAGKLQNVLADQVGGVLAPPALGVVGPLCQAGLWKATSLDQMQQGLIGSHAAVGTPLPHRYRVEVQMQVAPGQRLARLAEGVHPRAAGDKQSLAHGPGIDHPLEPGLPIGHFVDLIKHQQTGLPPHPS
jgi:hypothetical protein